MKRVVATQMKEPNLTASETANYLRQHPEFFTEHLDLLESITVPHPSGSAVSLVARQLDLLREKQKRLTDQLDGLVRIARDNDVLHHRIHQLTLTLLETNSVADVLASLDWGLHQYFQADFSAVRLLEPKLEGTVSNLFVSGDSPEAAWCEALLAQGKPVCGAPDPQHAAFLYGAEAEAVESQALIALQHAGVRGLFAIGSRDPARFRADMGFVFLVQMSEILAARLAALLSNRG
jgi:uncharacterized protein YigA (DUF484 family)